MLSQLYKLLYSVLFLAVFGCVLQDLLIFPYQSKIVHPFFKTASATEPLTLIIFDFIPLFPLTIAQITPKRPEP